MSRTTQRTINVDGDKIRMKAYKRTSGGCHGGFLVTVNGVKRHVNCLTVDEAFDYGFANYIKNYR